MLNVVPRDTLTLLTALHLSDKLTVPVPHLVAYPGADFWWAMGVGEAPGGFVDYARYLFVADGEKARREMGFEPRYTSREALTAFLEYRYPEEAARAGRSRRPGYERAGEGGADQGAGKAERRSARLGSRRAPEASRGARGPDRRRAEVEGETRDSW